MFKKIVSLTLAVCMLLALGVSVSAEPENPTLYLTVSNGAVANQVFVDLAIKNNIAPVDANSNGAIEQAEASGIGAFQAILDYDKTKFNLVNIAKTGSYVGDITANTATATAVWANAGGLYASVTDPATYLTSITGIEEASIVRFVFMVNTTAITEEDYGADFNFVISSSSTIGAINCTVDVDTTAKTYTYPDTREPIAGLTATPVEGLKYTGTAFAAEDLVTINTAEGDTVTYVTEPAEVLNAGTYKVTATVKRAGCKATDVSADVVIGKADTTITLASDEITYGETEYTKDFTVADGVDKAEITVSDYTVSDLNAGEKEITATATSANYNVTVVPGTLTVNKQAINVTMADKTMTYGDALPEFTSDAPAGVTITPTVAAKPNAGTVDITATAESANYDVTVVPGTLTVNKKALTITAQNEFQVQGRGEIAEYKAAVVEGLVEGDEITNIVVGFKGTYADAEGTYATEVKSYDDNANYEITTVDGIYEIKTALPVVITFGENKKTYGDDDADIAVTGDLDKVTIVRKANEDAGTYTDAYEVTLKVAEDEATGLPYALTVNNNVFVIEPKAATITIAAAAKKVGEADPEFTAAYEGFLEEPAEITFTRAAGETAGEYAITTAYADPNYAITVNGANLVITKNALAVAAKNVIVYLGKEIPAFTADVTGVVGEDVITVTYTVKNEEGTVVDPATIDTNVEAVYTIEVTSDANTDKYDVTYTNATLTIRKASGRPSGGGTVIKPATGGSTTTPEDKDDKEEDKEDNRPAASAKISMKENASEIKFAAGYEDKTFRPDDNATRNDVVAAITELFDVTEVENAPTFEDTDDSAIKDLAAAGVINGYEDGTFKGHNDVTRAEFVKLVAAALKLEAIEGAEANFSDIEGHWAAEWIKTFVAKGYIVGYPDGTFRPEDKITRAEMVVVMTRVAGTVDAEAAISFADVNETHWAYEYIKNAAK